MQSKNVLITRPQGQELEIMADLKQAGWCPWHQPLLEILPMTEGQTGFQDVKQKMMNIDLYDVIITVSANASSLAHDWIDQYWPQLPVGISWFAVGPSSAQALLPLFASDADIQLPQGNHTEGLLELAELQDLQHKKVLILRGVGGRELLAQTLVKRGAQVDYAELYQRQAIDISQGQLDDLVSKQNIQYAVITSGEMAQQLTQGLSTENKSRLTLLLPSQRIKNMISNAGFKHLHVIDKLSSANIISELNTLADS